VGDLTGEPRKSLNVKIETGEWLDRAKPDAQGKNPISLYAALLEASHKDAGSWHSLRSWGLKETFRRRTVMEQHRFAGL
jgi:hypothetical protein